MDILEVYPKDWHIRLDLSLTQLNRLLDFLDNCEFVGDLQEERNIKAKEYVMGEFFPKLNQISEDMSAKGIPNGA